METKPTAATHPAPGPPSRCARDLLYMSTRMVSFELRAQRSATNRWRLKGRGEGGGGVGGWEREGRRPCQCLTMVSSLAVVPTLVYICDYYSPGCTARGATGVLSLLPSITTNCSRASLDELQGIGGSYPLSAIAFITLLAIHDPFLCH